MKQEAGLGRLFWILLVGVACGLCVSCMPEAKSDKHYILVFRRNPDTDLEHPQFNTGAPIRDPLALLNVEDSTLRELPDFPVYSLEAKVVNGWPVLSWSPDGRYVLYVASITSPESQQNREIFRADADGSNIVNLTNNPAADERPIWSPDGQYIAFTSGRDTCGPDRSFEERGYNPDDPMLGRARLYIMRPDGSDVHPLILPEDGVGTFSWSPDSQHLVVEVGSVPYDSDIPAKVYVVSRDGSEVRELVTADEILELDDVQQVEDMLRSKLGSDYVIYPSDAFSNPRPSWSPSGEYIRFTVMGDIEYMIRPDGSGIRRLVPRSVAQATLWPEYEYNPSWSPDGKYMAVNSNDGFAMVEVENGALTRLGYMKLSGLQSFTWTPDSRYIILNGYSGGGKYDIYSLDVASRELVNLTAAYPESFTLVPEWVAVAP